MILHVIVNIIILSSVITIAFSSVDTITNLDSDILNRAQESSNKNLNLDKNQLSDCQVCRALVNSFNKGLRETARGKFEGGDAYWEESRLRSYKDSELRLIEIQEKLCEELATGKEQCHTFAEDQETTIEKWWFHEKKNGVDLLDYLCIETTKRCCPYGTYGVNCSQCPTCSEHGTCKGNGTRKGNGKCTCFDGYSGEQCEKCASGYFQVNTSENASSSTEENEVEEVKAAICEKCDISCLNHCRHKGPKGCEICKSGYQWDSDYGCLDIDECLEYSGNPCKSNTFCINTEGSYSCFRKLIYGLFNCLNMPDIYFDKSNISWPLLNYRDCCMRYCLDS